MRNGVAVPDALIENETLWANSHYVVHRHLLDGTEEGSIHLSIRDNKRRAVRDWRHLQRIKNELAGKDREAIEIFPPDEQLIDTANQYHLFVLPKGQTTPYTWKHGRHVGMPNDDHIKDWVASMGQPADEIAEFAKQRPVEES